MPLTSDYKETIRQRVQRDPEFRDELLQEAMECLFSGDVQVGKSILKDFIKATVGFETLSQSLNKKPESVIRMFGPNGNPTVSNFFQILAYLQKQQGIQFSLKLIR